MQVNIFSLIYQEGRGICAENQHKDCVTFLCPKPSSEDLFGTEVAVCVWLHFFASVGVVSQYCETVVGILPLCILRH